MKLFSIFIIFLFIAAPTLAGEVVIVKNVINGYTLELTDGRKVTLLGVATPGLERDEKAKEQAKAWKMHVNDVVTLGIEAKDFLEGMIKHWPGSQVRLEYKKDPFPGQKELQAFVFQDTGFTMAKEEYQVDWMILPLDHYEWFDGKYSRFHNATIIKAGYSDAHEGIGKYDALFLSLRDEAKKMKRGLWR